MSTAIDSYITGMDAWASMTGATDWRFQTFTASQSYNADQIKLLLGKAGTDTGTITVSIRATDAQSPPQPTGADLVTATISIGDLTAIGSGGAVETLTFNTTMAFVSGTRYAIVVRASIATGVAAYWRLDSTSAAYANGNSGNSGDAGANWNNVLDGDFYFITLGASFGAASAPTDKFYSKTLITFGNNEVWYEATAGTLSEVTDAHDDIDTTQPLRAVAAFQKVFIINGSNFKVLDLVNSKITTASVDGSGEPPGFGTVLTGGSSGAKMIVDYIDAATGACNIYGKRTTTATFTSGETVTGTNASGTPYAGSVSFVTDSAEDAHPHWYDWTVYADDSSNFGSMPDKAYTGCRYRGRLNISADPNYPHQWYQSRQKNPFDFLYVAGDAQSPVAGNDADCSEVGDIVKALIPYHDDYLIIACANELWYLSGDAAFGGELNILSDTDGILGDRAWCWDDKKRLYMLCTSGLLRVPVGFQTIENLTNELWPDFIADLAFNASLHRIVLAFDPENQGIHIYKTVLATGVSTAWWYDLRTEGLFPDSIPANMGVYSATYYQTEDPSYRKLLLGCVDGYVRYEDPTAENDDSTAINSYVGFAPLRLSTDSRKDGELRNIDLVMGGGGSGGSQSDSSNVTCDVHVSKTAEGIIEALDGGSTPKITKTFTAPGWSRKNKDRRSVRGQWAGIVLKNSTVDQSWSMERLILDTKEIGRSR